MPGNPASTVYIGNLDEKVSERVLYDILIQAGRVVDLYIPRDKETDRPKGFAFAEYETEEIADYAVKLFSGLVTLYKRTLRFAISGQDKLAPNLPKAVSRTENLYPKSRPHPVPFNNTEFSQHNTRFREHSYDEVPVIPDAVHQPNGDRSHFDGNGYSRRVFGETLEGVNRTRSRRFDTSNPIAYPPF